MDREEERRFTEFVEASGDGLLGFARLLVGDPGDAEDALQVALLRVARNWHTGIESPRAYARQALLNVARDRARRRHLVPALTRSGALPEAPGPEVAGAHEARESLELLLEGLPPRQRMAVVLRVVEGLSESETAAAMRCAPGTAKSNLARGLRRVRENHARQQRLGDGESGAHPGPVTDDQMEGMHP